MRDQDKFRGCLIGGAAGDALSYAVEFLRKGQIFRKHRSVAFDQKIAAYECLCRKMRVICLCRISIFSQSFGV